jgi:hypothetical protein
MMDRWDRVLAEEEHRDRVHALVTAPQWVLFFRKGEAVYAAPEESRVVFAKLKSRGDEDGSAWKKEADFMAVNLTSYMADGRLSQSVLGQKDLKRIRVIDPEDAERELLKVRRAAGRQPMIGIVSPPRRGE